MTKTNLGLCFQLGCTARVYADELAPAALVLKFDKALDQSEQRVVLAAADVVAGLPLCSALACEDIAAEYVLAAKFFKTQPLGI